MSKIIYVVRNHILVSNSGIMMMYMNHGSLMETKGELYNRCSNIIVWYIRPKFYYLPKIFSHFLALTSVTFNHFIKPQRKASSSFRISIEPKKNEENKPKTLLSALWTLFLYKEYIWKVDSVETVLYYVPSRLGKIPSTFLYGLDWLVPTFLLPPYQVHTII